MYICVHVCVCVCVYGLYSPPSSSVHGILQTRILEWVAMLSSRGSSWPKDWTHISYVSCTGRRVLYHWFHLGSLYIYVCIYIHTYIYTHIHIYIYIYMINPWCCKVTNRNIYESLNTQIEISVPDTLELSRTTQDFSSFIYAILLLHNEVDFLFSHYWQHLFSLLMIQ